MSWGDMLIGGVVRKKKPFSLMSKGEKIKELPSMSKRDIVENSCH